MNMCIYSKQDDSTATFSSAEHIIPKCIGGIHCLPKGWVSDEVNNSLSKLELSFSRQNPIITLHKMFGPNTGRKRHNNRCHVGIFVDSGNASELSLGYVSNGKPILLNQIVFTDLTDETIIEKLEIKIKISPSQEFSYEELIKKLWDALERYNGSPYCIKNNIIPQHTYLLGLQDHRWFFGISNDENPEAVKPLITQTIQKIIARDLNKIINGSDIKSSSTPVSTTFSINFNFKDSYRIYAKTALNCLAFLKGQDYALLPEFDNIRKAILTGEDILDYVHMSEGKNPVMPLFNQFSNKIVLGSQCHSVVIINKNNCLFGIVALYGSDNPVIVKLSEEILRFEMDIYICDWQNHKDYKLVDYILKICEHD